MNNINFETLNRTAIKKRMLIPVITWVVIYIICRTVLKEFAAGNPTGLIIALLPSAAFVWVIISFIKNVSLMDELQRRIYLEASAIAFALGLLLIMTLGMISLVITLNKEDWDYRHLIPFMFVFYFIGLAITRKKYS
ncbi:MAG TPA: hypothetical protein VHP32_07160 [Ignavibacteria bacterium]|nr:hypothetical protein [Ignavibacteria bacterium]